MIVNKQNYQEALETVLYANVALQNYNSECFGSSDIRLASAGTALVEKMVDAIVESSNSIYALVQPTFLRFGYDCNHHYKEEDFAHITEVNNFSVDLSAFERIFSMGEFLKKDAILEDFLKNKEYR